MTNKKIIEMDGKSVFDTFENVEKVKPSDLYPFNIGENKIKSENKYYESKN